MDGFRIINFIRIWFYSLKSLNLDSNHIVDINPLKQLNNSRNLHLNYQYYNYGNLKSYNNRLYMRNPLSGVDTSAITYVNCSGFYNEFQNSFKWENVEKFEGFK